MVYRGVDDKTMENRRNRVDIRIVTSAKDYEKLVTKPNFVTQMIFKLVTIKTSKK